MTTTARVIDGLMRALLFGLVAVLIARTNYAALKSSTVAPALSLSR